ncbi:MAG: large subunit ribosomal protein L10 [Gammaproteobacteria bacterium]|jgi:large subunit ribosomal protein L10
MPLTLADKKQVVTEVADVANRAHSAVAAEYRGLSVAQMTELREKARESGVYLRVVRNTLARRAVENTEFECLQEGLTGPLVLAFAEDDPGASARVMGDYAKNNEKLVIRLIAFGGKLLPASDLAVLAKMPTRDQALAQLLGTMKAPIEKFVRTLAEPHAKLVRTFDAVRRQQEAG